MHTLARGMLVAVVVAVAAAFRLGFLATARVNDPAPGSGAAWEHRVANWHDQLYATATGATVPEPFLSPGYPAVLAVCRWIGGPDGWYEAAMMLQLALGAATVLLVHRLARHFLGFGLALGAAALCAVSPQLIHATVGIGTSCVTTFVLVAGLSVLCGARTARRRTVAAALLGLAVLCNETLLFLPLLGALAVRAAGRRAALAFVLVGLAPFAAWTAGNVASGRAPAAGGGDASATIHTLGDLERTAPPGAGTVAARSRGRSWNTLVDVLAPRIAADPAGHAYGLGVEKPVRVWVPATDFGRDQQQPSMQLAQALTRPLLLPVMLGAAFLALATVVRRRAGWHPARVLAATVLLGTFLWVPMDTDGSARQPFLPLQLALGVAAIASAVTWGVARIRAKTLPAAAAGTPEA